MRLASVVIAVVILLSVAGAAVAATAGPTASCGTSRYSGKRWAIVSLNTSCADAKKVIKAAAPKLKRGTRAGLLPGRFRGFSCVYATRGRNAVLTCTVSNRSKLVTGVGTS